VLTSWTAHLQALAGMLRQTGHDPVVLKGGMGAKERAAALTRLETRPGGPPLLAVATGPYAGEGFDCPALDTLFLAAPVSYKGRLVQYAGRILRPCDGKTTAEVHDYHDELTGAPPATPASASPTPANSPTRPAPTRCVRQSRKNRQSKAVTGQAGGRSGRTGCRGTASSTAAARPGSRCSPA
jgi:hypothetical protein